MIDIHTGISSTLKRTEKVNKYLQTALKATEEYDYQKTSDSVEASLYQIEKSLFDMREVLYSTNINYPEAVKLYWEKSSDSLDINIEKFKCNYPVYKISFPLLLPNRRSKWTLFKDTLGANLFHKVQDFCNTNKITPFKKSAVVIASYYNTEHLSKYRCDNDNKETSDLLNILTNFFIQDDDGLICDLYNFSRKTTGNTKTEIFIMEQSRFADFVYMTSNDNDYSQK